MPTETETRVALTMLAIRALRQRGVIAEDAAVTPAAMAYISQQIDAPVSKSTFHRLTKNSLALARLALNAHSEHRTSNAQHRTSKEENQ